MLNGFFTINFQFPLEETNFTIPLTAEVKWNPDNLTYIVCNIRNADAPDSLMLPSIEIRRMHNEWVHYDSEVPSLLSREAGIAIDAYEQARAYYPPEIYRQLSSYLDRAIAADNADFGNIQLLNMQTQTLHIVCQRGFGKDFLQYFETVTAGDASACGSALGKQQTVVIRDVLTDNSFAPHREIALASGFRSVTSVPVIGNGQHLLGMLSIHSRKPKQDWKIGAQAVVIRELGSFLQTQMKSGIGY